MVCACYSRNAMQQHHVVGFVFQNNNGTDSEFFNLHFTQLTAAAE